MNRLSILVLSAVLALPAAAAAQPADGGRPQFGVGISVVPFGTSNLVGTTEILVPIQVAPTLRLEPSLGILTEDDGDVYRRRLSLGVGVLMQQRLDPTTDLHFGGRLKLGFAKVDVDGVGDDTGNDVIIAGAFGGEHWLSPHFSLGLEAQLGYYSVYGGGDDTSGFYTAGLFLARVFF